MTLDVGTLTTSATAVLRIVGFSQRADNDNAATSAKYLVKINMHQLAFGTVGV
jgi:hypothetical protein